MALAANDYAGHLKKFNDKYGMGDYDLKAMAEVDEKFRYVNAFLTGGSVNGPSGQFIAWLSKAMNIYFEKHSKFEGDWKKNLFKFNTEEFVNDFEKVAKAKYLSELKEGEPEARDMYAGAKKKEINLAIGASIQNMNKPVPTLWMERMRKGVMKVEEIQQTSENLTLLLNHDENSRAELMSEFTRIVAAREAVRQLRESRKGVLGFLWKIFNFRINGREKACLESLNNCVTTWEAKQFNTANVLNELMGKTALGRSVNSAEKAKQPDAVQELENEASVNSTQKKEVKAPQMGPVAKQLDEALKQVNNSAMGQELFEKLPSNGQLDFLRTTSFGTLWKFATQNVGEINADFDSAVANGADPQSEMEHVVRKVFVAAFKNVKTWGEYTENADKIAATKIVAQMIIERHTALALYADTLGNAVNGYIAQYTETLTNLTNENKNFADAMEELEFELMNNADFHEKVFDSNNNPFKENDNIQKSQRVELDDSDMSMHIDLD